jgi:hypothetical protein
MRAIPNLMCMILLHWTPTRRRVTTLGMPVIAKATLTAQWTGTWMEAMQQPSRRILAEARLATPVLYVRAVERGAVIDSFTMRKRT